MTTIFVDSNRNICKGDWINRRGKWCKVTKVEPFCITITPTSFLVTCRYYFELFLTAFSDDRIVRRYEVVQ